MPDNTPNADIDPSAIVQGHNGEVQRFSCKRSTILSRWRYGRTIREFLIEDQFGNLYLIHRANLKDGDLWDLAASPHDSDEPHNRGWINRPKLIQEFGRVNEDLLNTFRRNAVRDFVATESRTQDEELPSNVENN